MNSNNPGIVQGKKGVDINGIKITEKFRYKPINGYLDSSLKAKFMSADGLYDKFLKEIFLYQINKVVERRTKYKLKNDNIFSGNNIDIHSGR